MEARSDAGGLARRMLLPAVIVVVTLVVLWMMQSLPTICPAIYPAPASCVADARLVPATWGAVAVIALFGATVAIETRLGTVRRDRVGRVMVVILAVAAVVALSVTLFASGFVLPF